ncbi:hypothetical protein K1719_015197 [Acacia pycnantha]|nr:hypothetical protein K1719_015197 [Acacia pycnantha]
MAVLCGIDKARFGVFMNMVLVSVGVVISSYGEIHLNVIGTVYRVTGIFAEALRLVLTQVLLQKGLTINPISSLFYIAPCSCVSLCTLVPTGEAYDGIVGRTGAVTIRVAGVLKDWILIALPTLLFPKSTITGLNIIGYAIALSGVVLYNYIKVKDVRASQLPLDTIADRTIKDLKLEKSSDIKVADNMSDSKGNNGGNGFTSDEEAPLVSSR